MSADDRLASRIGDALRSRVEGAASADVKASEWRGQWRAWAHVYATDGRASWMPSTYRRTKREALRALAAFARIPDAELADKADAP